MLIHKTNYYINEQLSSKGKYSQGRIEGLVKGYYTTGEKRIEYNYKHGKLNGKCTDFYQNGNLKQVKVYAEATSENTTDLIASRFFPSCTLSNKLSDSIVLALKCNGLWSSSQSVSTLPSIKVSQLSSRGNLPKISSNPSPATIFA